MYGLKTATVKLHQQII